MAMGFIKGGIMEEKNIPKKEPVVKKGVTEKKQTLTEVLGVSPAKVLFSGFFRKFIIPEGKALILKAGTFLLSNFLYNGQGSSNVSQPGMYRFGQGGYVNYTNYSYGAPQTGTSYTSQTRNESFQMLIYEDREDAERVLSGLVNDIINYGHTTVLSYYDLSRRTAPYTADKFGWRNLNGVDVQAVPEGWVINLPDPVRI